MALPTKLTKTDAAELLGISRVTLNRRIEADVYAWPPVDLPALVVAHVAYELAGRIEGDEHEKLLAARRRKLEIEIAALEGSLVSVDDVRDGVSTMLSNARSRLLAIPNALAQRLNPEQPAQAHEALTIALYDALHELADYPFGRGGNGHAQ